MLEYPQGDVNIAGVKIHYYRTGGAKPSFILLHGATGNGLCWTPVAELLSRQYDVIMPDAQGHGLSDRIDSGFTYERHTAQVDEVGVYGNDKMHTPALDALAARSVRLNRHYIASFPTIPEPGGSELYNMTSDPGQENNVISQRQDIAAELHQLLVDFVKETKVPKRLMDTRLELRL